MEYQAARRKEGYGWLSTKAGLSCGVPWTPNPVALIPPVQPGLSVQATRHTRRTSGTSFATLQ
jgi:hypothetical protein